MQPAFLRHFLELAQQITQAERGLVVDAELEVHSDYNLDDAALNKGNWRAMIMQTLREALSDAQPVLTNNLIRDPSQVPSTNTSYRNLRLMVAFPVLDKGAIYLDQAVQTGVITSDDLARLQSFARYLVEQGKTDLDGAAMLALYHETFAAAH